MPKISPDHDLLKAAQDRIDSIKAAVIEYEHRVMLSGILNYDNIEEVEQAKSDLIKLLNK